MNITQIKIPKSNYGSRPKGIKPYVLVLHYTGTKNVNSTISWFRSSVSQVSSHYLIHSNGDIYQFVDEKDRAFHAGVSEWDGKDDVNDFSIGIEMTGNGLLDEWTDPLMASLIDLSADIINRWQILKENVVDHHKVAGKRKADIGGMFNWNMYFECLQQRCLHWKG